MLIVLDMLPQSARIELVQMQQSNAALEVQLTARAKANGWSDSQATWIGRLGVEALGDNASPTPEQVMEAYKTGERRLSVGYFNNALNEGKSRLVAFLTVIDLEKQVIERGGGKAPAYSDDALKAAYGALENAAAHGASVDEQLAVAFARLRQLASQPK